MNKRSVYLTIGFLVLLLVSGFLIVQGVQKNLAGENSIKVVASSIGIRTKISGCVAKNSLPDKDCTPGQIFPEATKEKICTPGYSSSVRNVPESEKTQVYQEYGIKTHTTGEYEVDHLISLELGGSNDISNLFPEAAEPKPGFHEKDKVENYLHEQVCNGKISLEDAQKVIANDWLSIWNQLGTK